MWAADRRRSLVSPAKARPPTHRPSRNSTCSSGRTSGHIAVIDSIWRLKDSDRPSWPRPRQQQVGRGITWSRYLIVSVDAKKRFEVRRACVEKAKAYIVSFGPVGA